MRQCGECGISLTSDQSRCPRCADSSPTVTEFHRSAKSTPESDQLEIAGYQSSRREGLRQTPRRHVLLENDATLERIREDP